MEKQQDRFKYEPDDKHDMQDELILPAEVKPLPKPKFPGVTMDKAQ